MNTEAVANPCSARGSTTAWYTANWKTIAESWHFMVEEVPLVCYFGDSRELPENRNM